MNVLRRVSLLLVCGGNQGESASLSDEEKGLARRLGREFLRDRPLTRVAFDKRLSHQQVAACALEAAGHIPAVDPVVMDSLLDYPELAPERAANSSPSTLLKELLATDSMRAMLLSTTYGDLLWRIAKSLQTGEVGMVVSDALTLIFATHFVTGGTVLDDLSPFGMVELNLTLNDDLEGQVAGFEITYATVNDAMPDKPWTRCAIGTAVHMQH